MLKKYKESEYYRRYLLLTSKNYTGDGYSEIHHIVPKSLGGDNSKSNLVRLKASDHYKAHKLLYLMTEGNDKKKMALAWSMMSFNRKDKITPEEYQEAREARSKAMSGNNHHLYGVGHSEDSRKKMSESRKALGIRHTEEHKDQLSKKLKGTKKPQRKVKCPFCHKVGGIGGMQRYHFDYCKQNPNAKPIDPKFILDNTGKKMPQKRVKCPHCGKIGGKQNMTRYHFGNCKYKKEEDIDD